MRQISFDPAPQKQPPATALGVLPETTLLACIGCVDLITTMYLLHHGEAHEANPLMVGVLQNFGGNGLVAAKALLLGGPLAIAEYARRQKPQFVQNMLRVGIAAYVLMYLVGFIRLNGH